MGNDVPVADAGSDQTVTIDDIVILSGNNSYDSDGDKLEFTWFIFDAPASSEFYLFDSGESESAFVPNVSGTYIFLLIVSDGIIESSPDKVIIFVNS